MDKITTPADDLEGLLEALKEGPMDALRDCRGAYRASARTHSETLHNTIAFIVAFVVYLQRSQKECDKFFEDDFWKDKPHQPKKKNLARLASCYVLGAKESKGALYQQALQYGKVASHFIRKGTEPEDIPDKLRDKPVYKLLDEIDPPEIDEIKDEKTIEDQRRAQAKNVSNDAAHGLEANHEESDTDSGDDDEEEEVNDDHDDGEGIQVDSGSSNISPRESGDGPAEVGGASTKAKRYPFKQKTQIAVAAKEWIDYFFEKMNPHDEVVVTILRTDDKDGWSNFEIIRLHEIGKDRTNR